MMETSLLNKEIMGYFVDRVEKQNENDITYYGYHSKNSSPVAIKVFSNDLQINLEKIRQVNHANLAKVS